MIVQPAEGKPVGLELEVKKKEIIDRDGRYGKKIVAGLESRPAKGFVRGMHVSDREI